MSVVANVAINVDTSSAIAELNKLNRALAGAKGGLEGAKGGLEGAKGGLEGFGGALTAALGPLAAVGTAVEVVRQSLATAFERNQAEQRLKNLTGSTQEYEAALGVAAQSAGKFGISQTDATKALADVYGRLKGVGFGLKETSEIYDGFNVIAKQSGLNAEDASGAFFQLSQALGKGKLNGDEFVIVAERMPQLLDAIAKTTGASRGELQKMAADGKITSQVLYEALAGSAAAAGDLNEKLTKQQQAFNSLGQVSDRLLNTLGKVFAPVVVAGATALVKAGQMLADWWDYLGAVIFPKVYKAIQPVVNELRYAFKDFDFTPIRAFLQNILIKGFETAISLVAKFTKVLSLVVNGFRALATNPVFKFIATQIGKIIDRLGLGNDKVGEFANRTEKAKTEAAGLASRFSSLPKTIGKSAEEIGKLKTPLEATLKNIKSQSLSLTVIEDRQNSINDIISAQLNAELRLNALKDQQLQREYDLAKTAIDRQNIAAKIFQNSAKAAQLEYQQGLSAIKLEQFKVELRHQQAILKGKEIFAEGQLQILTAKTAEEEARKRDALSNALEAQNQVIVATGQQIGIQKIVGEYQRKAIESQYQAKILTAQQALEQKLVSEQIGMSSDQAQAFAGNMASSYTSSQAVAAVNKELESRISDAGVMVSKMGQNYDTVSTSISTASAETEAWRQKIIDNINAQGKVAIAVQETTKATASSYQAKTAAAVASDLAVAKSSQSATKTIANAWQSMVNFLRDAMAKVASFVPSVWNGILNTIRSAINRVLNAIGSSINSVARAINRLIAGFNQLPGPDIGFVPFVSVPQFAEGGIVSSPTLAMVGEGGQREYIIPESKMAAASAAYMAGARGKKVFNGGGGTTVPVININTGPVVEFDGKRYVSIEDLEQAMRITAQGVIGQLRTPAARIALRGA
jgi:tape measure domain-containing protein